MYSPAGADPRARAWLEGYPRKLPSPQSVYAMPHGIPLQGLGEIDPCVPSTRSLAVSSLDPNEAKRLSMPRRISHYSHEARPEGTLEEALGELTITTDTYGVLPCRGLGEQFRSVRS